MFGRRKEPAKKPAPPPLRAMALTGDLPPRPHDAPGTADAALMDMGMRGALATVCVYSDGTASLYLSTGGGVIGAGTDPRVNAAARAFIALAEASMELLAPTDASPDLPEGHTRFVLRIGGALWGAEVPEAELSSGAHPLRKLWLSGHNVLTGIRVVSQERQRG